MGWHGVWSRSKPRGTPAEGPTLTKARGSGRTPRHSRSRSPGAEQEGKQVKLVAAEAKTLCPFQFTSL